MTGSHALAHRRLLAIDKRPPQGWRCAVLLTCALLMAGAPQAQELSASEAQVKAAYLHKLPGFVEWPADAFASPNAPWLIGVVDADAVLAEVQRQTAGRLVQGRPVEVRRLSMPAASVPVHVLFVGRDAQRATARWLALAAGQPVLTVTDDPAGLGLGAVLNLVQLDGRIRIEASLPAAAAHRLKLSSRLLGVASRVVERTP